MRQLKIVPQITNRDSENFKRYLSEVATIDTLNSIDREVELAERIQKGDESAKEELVKRNLRFVISVAKQYQMKGIELNDLINEGNIGLITAAQRFDTTKGFKFISYAVWWIRQSIMSYINSSSQKIRMPLNKVTRLNKLKKYENQLICILERKPSNIELSSFCKEKYGEDYSENQIDELNASNRNIISLDMPIESEGYSDGCPMSEFVEGDSLPTDFSFINKDKQIILEVSIKKLDERSQIIIKRNFGLFGNVVSPLEEIALDLDISRERTRQLRENSIRRLKKILKDNATLKELMNN